MVGQGAALAAAQGGLGLERADALHVGVGRLAGEHGFERFGVLVVIGEQQFVGDAELRQQFAAARALGGEVEEVVGHGAHRENRCGDCNRRRRELRPGDTGGFA
ncbi:hypothetical protein D3C86_1211480 [compost metagenome]